MANYECITRTNYFHVKNEANFRAMMERYHISGENLWNDIRDENGDQLFGFGFYSTLEGIIETGLIDEEDAFENFLKDIMEEVADNDAVIIFETGHEKMRYVTGNALIITSKKVRSIDLTTIAIDTAAQMLGDENYNSRCEY